MSKKPPLLLLTIVPALLLTLLYAGLAGKEAEASSLYVGCDADPASRRQALIQAIESANTAPEIALVTLDPGCQYILSTPYSGEGAEAAGLPEITTALTIAGQGASIVRSGDAPAFRLLQVAESGRLALQDLNLQNGSTPGDGGGVRAHGPLTLANVAFLHNNAVQLGGAVFGVAVTVHNGYFESNTSNRGGAVYVQTSGLVEASTFLSNTAQANGGGLYAAIDAEVRNSHFDGNHGIEGSGGGLYVDQGKAVIAGTTFAHNTAGRSGGGAVVWSATTPIVMGSQFIQNTAGHYGGGLYIYEAVSLTSSIFLGNLAVLGGGVYVGHTESSGETQIVNSLFARNQATERGAAMLLMPTWGQGGGALLQHTTITSPTLAAQTAVSVDLGRVTMQNNIVTHHTTGLAIGQDVVFSGGYNLFYGNVHNYQGPAQEQESALYNGLVEADPHFADPYNDDYQLADGSPALDSASDLGLMVDLAGAPRPGIGSSASDRGAYERQSVIANVVLHMAAAFPPHLDHPSPGAPLTYTLAASNRGSAMATGIILTATTPAALTDLIVTPGGVATSGSAAPGFVWQLPDLTPGMAVTVTMAGIVDPGLPEGTVLTSQATVSALHESTLADNSTSLSVTVQPAPGDRAAFLPIAAR